MTTEKSIFSVVLYRTVHSRRRALMCFLGWQVQSWFYLKRGVNPADEPWQIHTANTYGTCEICGATMRARYDMPASVSLIEVNVREYRNLVLKQRHGAVNVWQNV